MGKALIERGSLSQLMGAWYSWDAIASTFANSEHCTYWLPSHGKAKKWVPPDGSDPAAWRKLNALADGAAKRACKDLIPEDAMVTTHVPMALAARRVRHLVLQSHAYRDHCLDVGYFNSQFG